MTHPRPQLTDLDDEQEDMAEDIAYEINRKLKPFGVAITYKDVIAAMGNNMYLTWIPEEHR